MTAKNQWNKDNTLFVGVRIMKSTEADIIRKLEMVENKSAYIKELIRKDEQLCRCPK